MRMTRPRGFNRPNRVAAGSSSRMTTGEPARSSAGEKVRPSTMSPPRISMKRSSAPNATVSWVRTSRYSMRSNTWTQMPA